LFPLYTSLNVKGHFSCSRKEPGGNENICNLTRQRTSRAIERLYEWVTVGALLTHCGRVTQICVFNTVKLGTSARSP